MSAQDDTAGLDAHDESLNQIGTSTAATRSGPNVVILSLFLTSPTLPEGKTIEMDLTDPNAVATYKETPFDIKEGIEYRRVPSTRYAPPSHSRRFHRVPTYIFHSVGIQFKVNYDVILGLRYIQVVHRNEVTVERQERMLGSYAPKPDGPPYVLNLPTEEFPSGMMARSGTYHVKSRIIDDDRNVYADFEWVFKLTKEW
ncbi:hypothetical protein FRC04_003274 [Tulasnella sp. 424]|nr:hypothetical protein FRC04_003274 [Tulasnella sp. 424]KAG8965907.1 hypothetical protein FRC05_002965 [Tulasnella sp. 425]